MPTILEYKLLEGLVIVLAFSNLVGGTLIFFASKVILQLRQDNATLSRRVKDLEKHLI